MQAIIIAGGKAQRLRPHTDNLPKCLVEVLGKPILRYQLEWLESHGIEDVAVACGTDHHEALSRASADLARGLRIRLRHVVEQRPLGKSGAARAALRQLGVTDREAFVVNGDLLTTIDLGRMREHHRAAGTAATIAVVPLVSSVGIVSMQDDAVTGFVEKPELPYWMNAGVYLLSPDSYEHLPDEGDETSFFPPLIRRGAVSAFRSRCYYRAIETAKDLARASEELGLIAWPTRRTTSRGA